MWERNKVIVLGHRGFSAKYPENTILAFQKAIEAGADGIELDVWLTKDGRVVVMHDETIDRTSNLRGRVKNMTLGEIRRAELAMGQRIPALEEVFEVLPEEAMVNIEIKDADAVKAAYNIVKRFNASERVLFSSFLVEALYKLRELDRDIKLALLVEDEKIIPRIPELSRELNLYSINVPVEGASILGMERFKQALMWIKGMGLKVALWAVNDTSFYYGEPLKELRGIFDIVITDDVKRMIEYLGGCV